MHPVDYGADAAGTVSISIRLVSIVLEGNVELPDEVETFALRLNVRKLSRNGALGGGDVVKVLDLSVRSLCTRLGLASVRLELVLECGVDLRCLAFSSTRVGKAGSETLVRSGLLQEVDESQAGIHNSVRALEIALGTKVRKGASEARRNIGTLKKRVVSWHAAELMKFFLEGKNGLWVHLGAVS